MGINYDRSKDFRQQDNVGSDYLDHGIYLAILMIFHVQ